MPAPSEKTAWDFLPPGWRRDAATGFATAPAGFEPVTQLEHARLGLVTREMRRVAEREAHLTRRAGARRGRGRPHGDPRQPRCTSRTGSTRWAIGRATCTKVNANMGASPVSSGTDEEVEKLRWAERWGADTVMDLSTGGDLDATREAIIAQRDRADRHGADLLDDHRPASIEDLDERMILDGIEHQAQPGRRLHDDPRRRALRAPALRAAPADRHRLARRLAAREVDDLRTASRTRCTRCGTTSARSCAATT